MNEALPDGQIYVCLACGKTSKTKAPGADTMRGWDVSCMLNSVAVYAAKVRYGCHGRAVFVDDDAEVKTNA